MDSGGGKHRTAMKTIITLEKMRFFARHGVMPQERATGNWFEVSARLEYPFEQAMADDDLSGTLDYGAAYETIRREMATPSKLLEHVAGRIKSALERQFPEIAGGEITVAKLHPPIPGATGPASVTVIW